MAIKPNKIGRFASLNATAIYFVPQFYLVETFQSLSFLEDISANLVLLSSLERT